MNVKIAKGIKGIRRFLATDASGWHVTVDDEYIGYFPEPASQILAGYGPKTTFTGFYGNTLSFTQEGAER